MLVNASHPLPLEWKPDALVDLWKVQPRHYHLYPRPHAVPEGREDVTGIPEERWHLRYVGHDAAPEMHERNWVLEEWHEAHQGA